MTNSPYVDDYNSNRISYPHVDIVFDGPPSCVTGRLVEVEDNTGRSRRIGKWIKRDDGYWVLRINKISFEPPEQEA